MYTLHYSQPIAQQLSCISLRITASEKSNNLTAGHKRGRRKKPGRRTCMQSPFALGVQNYYKLVWKYTSFDRRKHMTS